MKKIKPKKEPDILGKSQEYWQKIEAEHKEMSRVVPELKTQVHEVGAQYDAEVAKSKTLSEHYDLFLNSIAQQLNVPAKPEEVTKAIAEIMSNNDTTEKMVREVAALKEALATSLASSTMFQRENNETVQKLNTTQETLQKTSIDLEKITQAYSRLLMQTGGKPKMDLHLFGRTLKLYGKNQ